MSLPLRNPQWWGKYPELLTSEVVKTLNEDTTWVANQSDLKTCNPEDCESIRQLMIEFFDGHNLFFEEREFTGYYDADLENRIIRGLYPVKLIEFFYVLFWATQILFIPDARFEESLEFLSFIPEFYDVPAEPWFEFIRRLQDYVEHRFAK